MWWKSLRGCLEGALKMTPKKTCEGTTWAGAAASGSQIFFLFWNQSEHCVNPWQNQRSLVCNSKKVLVSLPSWSTMTWRRTKIERNSWAMVYCSFETSGRLWKFGHWAVRIRIFATECCGGLCNRVIKRHQSSEWTASSLCFLGSLVELSPYLIFGWVKTNMAGATFSVGGIRFKNVKLA